MKFSLNVSPTISQNSTKQTLWRRLVIAVLLLLLTYGCWLMLKIVVPYASLERDTDFLLLKQRWAVKDWWIVAFRIHVFASGIVLLAGFSQFWGQFRSSKYRKWHRCLGYVYVLTILLVALPSGLVLAVTALGGWIVQASFLILCALWGYTTLMAVAYARRRQMLRHQHMMVYSYALSMSAVTLRTLKLILYAVAPYFPWLTPMTIYRTESVLAWIINLGMAWLWLRFSQKKAGHHTLTL